MKGDPAIIKLLNAVLTNELTAVNQYFLHSRILEDWGFAKLGKKLYEESIEEMQHADSLIKRILFLEGLPNLQDLDTLSIGQTVREIHEADLVAEKRAVDLYTEASVHCQSVKDVVSRQLFESLINDEEGHIDWLETQVNLMNQLGDQNYLQLQVGEGAGE